MQTQEVRVLGFRVIELSCASRLSSHAPAADFESSLSLFPLTRLLLHPTREQASTPVSVRVRRTRLAIEASSLI